MLTILLLFDNNHNITQNISKIFAYMTEVPIRFTRPNTFSGKDPDHDLLEILINLKGRSRICLKADHSSQMQ
jgi:hypothetical protein